MITQTPVGMLSQAHVGRVTVGVDSVYVDGAMPRSIKECERWYRQDRSRVGSPLGVQAAAYRRSIQPRKRDGFPAWQTRIDNTGSRCGGRWGVWESLAADATNGYERAKTAFFTSMPVGDNSFHTSPALPWPRHYYRVAHQVSIYGRISDVLWAIRNHKLRQMAQDCNRMANQMWSQMYSTNWPNTSSINEVA